MFSNTAGGRGTGRSFPHGTGIMAEGIHNLFLTLSIVVIAV
jgi:hypothetical protein